MRNAGMREVGPDGSFYLRVGTQWVKVSWLGLHTANVAVIAELIFQ